MSQVKNTRSKKIGLEVNADKTKYSKTCLKRNAIVPVFFFSFSQVSVLQRVVF